MSPNQITLYETDLGYVNRNYILSICIPTFNRANYIEETLHSIIPQLNDNVELIIVDGASTDNTGQKVLNVCEGLTQVRYLRQEFNGGIDHDMARSVALASANYCWLFSSDDIIKHGAVNKVLRLLGDCQSDIILCGMTLCTKDMKPIVEHHIWNLDTDLTFDLSVKEEREVYFRKSLTTTALFSFLGNIILKRNKWLLAPEPHLFMGGCWAHVARFCSLIPKGLTITVIKESFLLNRGGNDSFSGKGKVSRIALSVDGYLKIANTFFGPESKETSEVIRILNYEWPFDAYVMVYHTLRKDDKASKNEMIRLFRLTHPNEKLFDKCLEVILKTGILRALWLAMTTGKNCTKKIIRLIDSRT